MRQTALFLFLIAITSGSPANASAGEFSGSWVGWVCPQPGPTNAARCASFSLRLLQKGDRVCGSHLFATAGARQMDEGGMPSLAANVQTDKATGTVESVRASPSVRIAVTLSEVNGGLLWQRLSNPSGDYLLPDELHLTRTRQVGLSPLSEQRLSAACSAWLDRTAEKDNTAASPATR